MAKFKVTTLTNQEKTVEADLYRDSENGQWVDFIRKGKGTGYNDPENVAEIERLQD
jgi:hypothetical protein